MLLNDCLTIQQLNKHLYNLQGKNKLFLEQKYNSWGEALGAYLDKKHGRGGKKKLAELLVDDKNDEKKIQSKQSQIGRWINDAVTPIDRTQNEINSLLNIRIIDRGLNEWYVYRDDHPVIEDVQKEYRFRKGSRDFSDNEKDLLLEVLLENAESLAVNLRRLIEIEKKRDSD